jgi:membrane fusion protein, multidrug efflux system
MSQGLPSPSLPGRTQNEERLNNSSPGSVPKSPGRRYAALAIAVVFLVVGLGVGVPYYLYTLTHKTTDDAFITGHITLIAPRVPGHVVKVFVEDNKWVEEGAPLVDLDRADYEADMAKANAMLQNSQAKLESAKAGLKLTSITANAGLDEATSGVKVSESAVDSARTRTNSAKTKLEQAAAAVAADRASAEESKAAVAAAEAQAEFDAGNLKRYEEMFAGGAITKQDMDRATAAARVSEANLQTARKKVASAEARVTQSEAARRGAEDGLHEAESQLTEFEASRSQAGARLSGAKSAPEKILVSEAAVHVAEAEVESARAAVREAELALSYTSVKAPRAGRITGKTVRQGSYVQTGQSLLAIVPADVWVIANFKETDLTHMEPGQPVTLYIDAYPDEVFQGRVDSIQAGSGAAFALLPPENASGNYIKIVQRVPVKIVFERSVDLTRYRLAPGMSVVPTVDVSVHPKGPERPQPSVKEPAGARPADKVAKPETPS